MQMSIDDIFVRIQASFSIFFKKPYKEELRQSCIKSGFPRAVRIVQYECNRKFW
jgi:hypothetical protein